MLSLRYQRRHRKCSSCFAKRNLCTEENISSLPLLPSTFLLLPPPLCRHLGTLTQCVRSKGQGRDSYSRGGGRGETERAVGEKRLEREAGAGRGPQDPDVGLSTTNFRKRAILYHRALGSASSASLLDSLKRCPIHPAVF